MPSACLWAGRAKFISSAAPVGRSIEGHDPTDPLSSHEGAKLAITAGDAQAIHAAHDRAISPIDTFRQVAAYVTRRPQTAHRVLIVCQRRP